MKSPPAHCATCGKLLVRPKPTGRIPRYCLHSNACKQKAYRRRRKAKHKAKLQSDTLRYLSDESFEWYTPKKFIDAARNVLGAIELDPASSIQANRMVKATMFFDQTQDGLTQTWNAKTVFLNPPYCKAGNTSNQDRWTAKLLREYKAGNVKEAILLITNATETIWFHRLMPFPMCFVKRRIQFTYPDREKGRCNQRLYFCLSRKTA
jgi:DNA N-6-adenine-methyltransferase (Dam)